jgi:hypothetical protein
MEPDEVLLRRDLWAVMKLSVSVLREEGVLVQLYTAYSPMPSRCPSSLVAGRTERLLEATSMASPDSWIYKVPLATEN